MRYVDSSSLRNTLRKKCPYSEFFWSVFSFIRTEYGDLLRKYPCSIRMQEIRTRKTAKTDISHGVTAALKHLKVNKLNSRKINLERIFCALLFLGCYQCFAYTSGKHCQDLCKNLTQRALQQQFTAFNEKCRLNLIITSYNQVSFGKKILRIFGLKIWNSLPYHIKSLKNLESFKTLVKNWDGVDYKCVICKEILTIIYV